MNLYVIVSSNTMAKSRSRRKQNYSKKVKGKRRKLTKVKGLALKTGALPREEHSEVKASNI